MTTYKLNLFRQKSYLEELDCIRQQILLKKLDFENVEPELKDDAVQSSTNRYLHFLLILYYWCGCSRVTEVSINSISKNTQPLDTSFICDWCDILI